MELCVMPFCKMSLTKNFQQPLPKMKSTAHLFMRTISDPLRSENFLWPYDTEQTFNHRCIIRRIRYIFSEFILVKLSNTIRFSLWYLDDIYGS